MPTKLPKVEASGFLHRSDGVLAKLELSWLRAPNNTVCCLPVRLGLNCGLSVTTAPQGSILDRIDYNIEMASHHVEKGRVELEQANTYQKRASKKLCIMLMIVICVGL